MRFAILSFAGAMILTVTSADAQQSLDYEHETAEIERQIDEANREASKYSGGLILVTIQLRIELLRNSRALIEQARLQHAIRHRGQPSTPARSSGEQEIALLCHSLPQSRYTLALAFPLLIKGSEQSRYLEVDEGERVNVQVTDDEYKWVLRRKKKGEEKEAELLLSLNRYTLEILATSKDGGEPEKAACRIAKEVIPASGAFWMICGEKGDPKKDESLKAVVGKNAKLVDGGGYLQMIEGKLIINRLNGYIVHDENSRWSVLDGAACRVAPRQI